MAQKPLPWEKLALAGTHPTQIAILSAIQDEGKSSPNELSQLLSEPLSNVSYHVACLCKKDLLKLHSTKPRRGAVEHFYVVA